MKITYITSKAPSLRSGSEVRNYHLVNALADAKEIECVTIIYIHYNAKKSDVPFSSSKIKTQVFQLPSRQMFASIATFLSGEAPYIHYLRYHPFQPEVERAVMSADVVILSELDGYFLAEQTLQKFPTKPLIFDCHNVDHLRFNADIALSPFPKNMLGRYLSKNIRQHETKALKQSSVILACSDVDKEIFKSLVPNTHIQTVPNGAVLRKLPAEKAHRPTLLFMGLLSYQPNEDAVRYYLNEIYARVVEGEPDSQLWILGKHPPEWLLQFAKLNASVQVLGYVEDLDEVFQNVDVCICPLRYGSGTRLKVLEYMAAGKAVVSTSAGAEGIDAVDGKNILIADRPEQFADAVVKSLADRELTQRIGKAARKLIEEKYDWQKIGETFVQIVLAQK